MFLTFLQSHFGSKGFVDLKISSNINFLDRKKSFESFDLTSSSLLLLFFPYSFFLNSIKRWQVLILIRVSQQACLFLISLFILPFCATFNGVICDLWIAHYWYETFALSTSHLKSVYWCWEVFSYLSFHRVESNSFSNFAIAMQIPYIEWHLKSRFLVILVWMFLLWF